MTALAWRVRLLHLLPAVGLLAAACCIGLANLDASGPLWPDAPRYANAAAMIHDWLHSDRLGQPYQFAQENYAQYPAFSLPFHPPAYPGLMGLFFAVVGVSYDTARLFVALCAGVSAIVLYALLRRSGVGLVPAVAAGLLFLTTPVIAHWTRCTMSEVPAFTVMLLASAAFLKWTETERARWCAAAFALAGVAFLCRVTTAGVIPGWVLYCVCIGKPRLLIRPTALLGAVVYLALSAGFMTVVRQFATYEVACDGKADGWSWANVAFFGEAAPVLLWGTTPLALLGAWTALRGEADPATRLGRFWLCWIVGYVAFKLFVPTSLELRHLFGLLAALPGLAAAIFVGCRRPAWTMPLLACGLVVNLVQLGNIPQGVVGHQAVARDLAALDEPGNILCCCWEDQDLMFRYRATAPQSLRQLLRGDRVLAVRAPDYAPVEAIVLAHSPDDVIDAVRKGRVRYLVTCQPSGPAADVRPEESRLAHATALASPEKFELLARHPLTIQFAGAGRTGEVFVWRYRDELPPGPSELPIPIPTANLQLAATK